MGMRNAAVVAGLALGLMSGTAKASVLVTFSQTAAGVVAAGGGTLNLAGLSPANPSTDSDTALVDPFQTSVVEGTTSGSPNETLYSIGGQNLHFGPTNTLDRPAIGTGDSFGVFGVYGFLVVPTGYVSNSALAATDTYDGATFASLGLTPGTYTLNIPNNVAGQANDTFTVQIGPTLSTVPLPASAPMFGAALIALGAAGYGLKRKSKAAAQA